MSEKWIINSIFLLKVVLFIILLVLALKVRSIILHRKPKYTKFLLFLVHATYFLAFFAIFFIEDFVNRSEIPKNLLYMVIGNILLLIPVIWFDHTDKADKSFIKK